MVVIEVRRLDMSRWVGVELGRGGEAGGGGKIGVEDGWV